MVYDRVSLERFTSVFACFTELSSVAIGGKIVAVSDEFFAEAHHLLLVEPPPSLKGLFGPKGALFSGWETRRHNPAYDWCIVKLGTAGTVSGFDIDTTHFNGNEAPHASVEGLLSSHDPEIDDPRWTEMLSKVDLGPSARHLFAIQESACVNYVKLKMYPDGGIARFRVYGSVTPVYPKSPAALFDLAHVFAGGRVERVSDQHFGVGANLLLPGRGKDMSDGWETKRSRQKGHRDWAIIKLGAPGFLEHVEIDTANFMGNFPESCELHALTAHDLGGAHLPRPQDNNTSSALNDKDEEAWTRILPRTKLGPHRRHYFQLEHVAGRMYTHVRLTIFPDGGVKRVRVVGRRAASGALAVLINGGGSLAVSPAEYGLNVSKYGNENGHEHGHEMANGNGVVNGYGASLKNGLNGHARANKTLEEVRGGANSHVMPGIVALEALEMPAGPPVGAKGGDGRVRVIPALPLTPEAFAPFGQVVQAYTDTNGAPRGTRVTGANQGTATKFHALAPVLACYPPPVGGAKAARTGLSVYRCAPVQLDTEGAWRVRVLERHPYTNQAFVPMGGAAVGVGEGCVEKMSRGDALENPGTMYLVIVAEGGGDDRPHLASLRAFVASAGQAVVYGMGVWHQPMTVLGKTMDFTCVETQIGNGDRTDCEIIDLEEEDEVYKVQFNLGQIEYQSTVDL